MLTPRQKQCLDAIAAFIAAHGHGPSYREIATALGMNSTGNAAALLEKLRQRGFVTLKRGQQRSIALTGKGLKGDTGGGETVQLSPTMAKEIDAIVTTRKFGSREAVVDWLLECALWSWTHGSLPPIEAHNRAPFEKEAPA